MKTVVVTGSARGLGRDLADADLALGCSLAAGATRTPPGSVDVDRFDSAMPVTWPGDRLVVRPVRRAQGGSP